MHSSGFYDAISCLTQDRRLEAHDNSTISGYVGAWRSNNVHGSHGSNAGSLGVVASTYFDQIP